jgi:hypothetical protein
LLSAKVQLAAFGAGIFCFDSLRPSPVELALEQDLAQVLLTPSSFTEVSPYTLAAGVMGTAATWVASTGSRAAGRAD